MLAGVGIGVQGLSLGEGTAPQGPGRRAVPDVGAVSDYFLGCGLLIVGWQGWFVFGRDWLGGHGLFGSRLGFVILGDPGVLILELTARPVLLVSAPRHQASPTGPSRRIYRLDRCPLPPAPEHPRRY